MKRRNTFSNDFGSSMRNIRLKVSWLGMPFFSSRMVRSSPSFARNSAMSVQYLAPHSVASRAMNIISVRS